MELRELLRRFSVLHHLWSGPLSKMDSDQSKATVEGVTSDSRKVSRGSVFVAVPGEKNDGHEFLKKAHEAGAIFLLGERREQADLPFAQVPSSRLAVALLSSVIHGEPSQEMIVIGVTGTSGKTTTTFLIESILKAAGKKTGLIGTIEYRLGGHVIESSHTTPDPEALQSLLRRMADQGCEAVVMEVSSHALKQCRVAGIAFDAMVFTNLTPEHLDYHPTMEDYYQSKRLLFTQYATASEGSGKGPKLCIHTGSDFGKILNQDVIQFHGKNSAITQGILTFSIEEATYKMTSEGVQGEWSGVNFQSPLFGPFNVQNLLSAISVGLALGFEKSIIENGIRSCTAVPGRLERVDNSKGIHIFVDYAHKPDALEKVIHALKDAKKELGLSQNKIITIFGCGGDRDRTKRPVMGKIASDLSDFVIVTSDNPRTEDPNSIIREIESGMTEKNFITIPDRKAAIAEGLRRAIPGDFVLIAGKGHEPYQIIADSSAPGGTRKIHFDDRETAAEILKSSEN